MGIVKKIYKLTGKENGLIWIGLTSYNESDTKKRISDSFNYIIFDKNGKLVKSQYDRIKEIDKNIDFENIDFEFIDELDEDCTNADIERKKNYYFNLYKNDCINYIHGKEADKKYIAKNKEKLNEKQKIFKKKWYENNKDKILEKQRKKFNCECGSEIRIKERCRHEKTQKHISFIESKNSNQ